MKIIIVGAGAMGSLFGGLLAEAGNQVFLIDIWKDHVDAINKKGLWIEGFSGNRFVEIKAANEINDIDVKPDLLIFFVKSYNTEKAAKEVCQLIDKGASVLTLQNGLGNIDILSKYLGSDRVIAGATSYGATIISPGKVFHAGSGPTTIGELNGNITIRIKDIANLFSQSGIKTDITQNVLGVIWSKLVINVGINALGVLLNVKNGELITGAFAPKLQNDLIAEALLIAKKKGIRLLHEDMKKEVITICEKTKDNLNSMLQDVIKKRKTEIDFINGAIVDEGKAYNISTPVNETITYLIKAIEEKYENRIIN